MSDEHEKKAPLHKETFFLPPLNMFLAFCDKESQQQESEVEHQEKATEKDLEKLIEKLSENEE